MLSLNVSANRHLREGDRIKVLHGDRSGRYAQVVGFDLCEADAPVVIQYGTASGGGRENVGANDVEYAGNFGEAPETLEPLPEIQLILTEMRQLDYQTCGRLLCVKLPEDGGTLSFVPKDDSVRLEETFAGNNPEAILKVAFVTRRPHLVEISNSKQIWNLLGAVSPGEAIKQLTA